MIRSRLATMALLSAVVVATAPPSSAGDKVRYQQDVRPLLSDRCYACHGPDEKHREADLRLDRREAALAIRDGKRALVPGELVESELWKRIASDDPDVRMPPPSTNKPLKPAEIELLRKWIEQGADWSEHWAYVPPADVAVPKPQDATWGTHPVDAFVAARLERAGSAPSPQADRVTLARRIHFDLTGLPPTPAEVDAFAKDDSSEAWEKLVDRLLASQAFGERMASYWLDLVRYADTVGYHGDQEHQISPYRDWVIDAFNDDMPFDRFTREQLAGDLLPDSGVDQKIASGYNRLLQTSHEGGVQVKEYVAIYAADRVRNVSAVWFGATIGCAQCHNHKFDPYTAVDFAALGAFFADLDDIRHLKGGADKSPTLRLPELSVNSRLERKRLAELAATIDVLTAKAGDPALEQSAKAAIDARLREAGDERAAIEKQARLTMISAATEPRETRLLPRGNWLDDSGPVVQPAVPIFLGEVNAGDRRATRLDLANWLTDASAGAGLLTARVQVNRYWNLLFGAGLAPVLDDFGGQGQPPVHPELLDWLAREFVRSGWDVKHLLRTIATSRAYRQAADYGAKPPAAGVAALSQRSFRVPAEAVRDAALAVSGLLVAQVGGPSVRPYQPADYYQYLNFPKRDYKSDDDRRQWRRGLYVHWQRQFLHPMLKNFDAPRREECTAQRPTSNTPLAALTLLNDPSFIEAARSLAAAALQIPAKTDDDRFDFVFRRAVSRPPDDVERGVLTELLRESRSKYAGNEAAAKELISIGLAPAPADVPATELAAWTAASRAVLNLGETYTRP